MVQCSTILQDRDAYPATMSMSRQVRLDTLPMLSSENIPITAHASLAATTQQRDSLPDSQESFVSTSTGSLAAPRLLSSSSNISNSTGADTELTSPTSSNGPFSQRSLLDSSHAILASPTKQQPQSVRPNAPRINTDLKNESSSGSGVTATSPMSVDFPPLIQGSKRTASGTVKSAGSERVGSSSTATLVGHTRNTSMDSNASRIGEV